MNPKGQKVLIVDDECDIRSLLEITLNRMSIETKSVATLASARDALTHEGFSLCLTDMRLPDGLGIDLVRYIQDCFSDTPVAVITAYGSLEDAVESLKAGAFDFVTKPVEVATLRRLVSSALKARAAPQHKPGSHSHPNIQSLTGNSSAIRALRQVIPKLARTLAPVHIRGESGIGKEVVAKMIHFAGPRASKPFVPVNCGAIPPDLVESELFGHLRGSFTGASENRAGLFAAAEGGTLFLDEIADLPLATQVKLLRAIQERRVRPVGSNEEVATDVRIISATHRNLTQLIRDGLFREDLFYRINVIEVTVPALRERPDDIPEIAQEILKNIALDAQIPVRPLTTDALEALKTYSFPGNIRELENILERASVLSDSPELNASCLQIPNSEAATLRGDKGDIDSALEAEEKRKIIEALKAANNNKTLAAKLLGISFRSLRYRLQKLDIE